jgi:hypothetical protein
MKIKLTDVLFCAVAVVLTALFRLTGLLFIREWICRPYNSKQNPAGQISGISLCMIYSLFKPVARNGVQRCPRMDARGGI